MAVIQQIRNRTGLIMVIIGASMLLFILSDALSNDSSMLFSQSSVVAEINGEEIEIQDFQKYVNNQIESYKANTGKRTLSTADVDQLREQSWNQLVFESILNAEINKLGIGVSNEELFDLVQGSNPHPLIRQAFTDPQTGAFDGASVLQFLKSMDFDQTGEQKIKWRVLEDDVFEAQLKHKYNRMITKGIYVTNAEAQVDHANRTKSAAIELISLKYNEVDDAEVNITEADIEAYYEEHKDEYKREASRNIEFVNFDIIPSKDDTLVCLDWSNGIIVEFKETKDDSVFVNLSSDEPFNNTFFKEGELSAELDSIMFSSDTGTVYGPYLENGAYRIAKLINKKNIPDSVNARHILIKSNQNRNVKAALALADSLKEEIETGKDFAEFVQIFSEDPGSKEKGGELGWFNQGEMVKPFNDMAFYYAAKGDVKIIRSQFGVHIIEILEAKGGNLSVQVGLLVRDIRASSATEGGLYSKANEFAGKNRTVDAFNQAITDNGFNKRLAENVKENDRTIIGIENARPVVKWANSAEVGQISKVIELDDKFVVAHLSKVTEEGPAILEDVRVQVEIAVKKDKKAEILVDRLSKAMQGSELIDQVADNLGSATIASMDKISFFDGYIPKVGRELALIGSIFASQPDQLVGPIKGEQGVYVFVIEIFQDVPEINNYTYLKSEILKQTLTNSEFAVYEALKEKGNVVDNRSQFY